MILIASALFPPEPVVSARLSFDLAEELSKTHEVMVVSPPPTRPYGMSFDTQKVARGAYTHQVIESYTCAKSRIFGRFRESFSLGLGLKRYIQENHHRITVIYANLWPLFAQNMLVNAARRYRIPVIMHVQDVYPEFLLTKLGIAGSIAQFTLLPLDRSTLQNSHRVIAISEKMKSYIMKSRGVSEDSVVTIRNWQNDSDFIEWSKGKNGLDGPFRFLYLGSINPTANVELLIHAFGKSKIERAELIIAGDGPDKKNCIELAKSYRKDIRFIEVAPEEVPRVQSTADVLLLPLKKGVGNASLPSKMTAYMFSKKTILASIDKTSEAAEIIEQNKCGLVVEAEQENALRKTMESLVELPRELLEEYGNNSFEFARKNLSKSANLARLADIIRNSIKA